MSRVIQITKGTGTGNTKLAAFDAALFDAGIANYNLIRLSSIIPPGSELRMERPALPTNEFGHKLYVVYASEIETEIGKEAWGGIGWVLYKDGSGRGLFVEHEGHSEQEVANLIHESLTAMMKYRDGEFSEIESSIVGITCTEKPVCALVAAVYESEGWH